MRPKLILIELNEINFDVVQRYVDRSPARFPAMRRLLGFHRTVTSAESEYQNLEPWVQWPSVHTGCSFAEHGVFRLGDIGQCAAPQFFEQLEDLGHAVGAISPMNAANRLRKPAYFIPDPWTATSTDGSFWSSRLYTAVSQAVNDNAKAHITVSSAMALAAGLLRFSRVKNWPLYLRLVLGARRASWKKALVLDLFLHDLHFSLFRGKAPDFSVLFLNAGAHIQHHYFFNSAALRDVEELPENPHWYLEPGSDPVQDMLEVYDRIVADYIGLEGVEVLLATGLSQKPYDRVKFYYRLRDHASFLRMLGIRFAAVSPRMTRDFLVEFDSEEGANDAALRLRAITVGRAGGALFGEVDNRGTSLFVTLTYPHEILDDDIIVAGDKSLPLKPHVAFVAIKNGMHQEKGFAFFSAGLARHAPRDGQHVKELHRTVLGFFGATGARKQTHVAGRDHAMSYASID